MSASLGLARWHMQNMQTSEFIHLLGNSSGSAVSWDVYRWHRTAISGILLWRGVLSRTGGGGVLLFFVFLLDFLYMPGRHFWMTSFAIAHFEFFIEILSSVAERYKKSLKSSSRFYFTKHRIKAKCPLSTEYQKSCLHLETLRMHYNIATRSTDGISKVWMALRSSSIRREEFCTSEEFFGACKYISHWGPKYRLLFLNEKNHRLKPRF